METPCDTCMFNPDRGGRCAFNCDPSQQCADGGYLGFMRRCDSILAEVDYILKREDLRQNP